MTRFNFSLIDRRVAVPAAAGGKALVQQAIGTTGDGALGLQVNFPVPVTVGNSVIALLSSETGNSLHPAPTMVGGGVGPLIEVTSLDDGLAVVEWMYFIHGLTGGETGVTLGMNGATRTSLQILELSGLANAAPEDFSAASDNSDAVGFPLVTPASPDNVIIGGLAYGDGGNDYLSGPTNGFIRLAQTGGNNIRQEGIYLIRSNDAVGIDSGMGLTAPFPYIAVMAAFG